jgi:methionine salvage enolase-phosphatase E1
LLNTSARAVRDAVKGKLEAGQEMDLHYDHPVLLLQPMIWHEGYHHGQIKLALKLAGYRFRAAKSAKEIFLPYACGERAAKRSGTKVYNGFF